MTAWLIIIAVAIIAALFLLYQANRTPQFNPVPPPVQFKKDMTIAELNNYDGVKNPKVLLALRGVIYDVSSSDFYGVGGGYHQFAGHDASINLAKMSHEEQFNDKYQEITLDREQTQVLNDWVARFQSKYPKVGVVLKNKVENSNRVDQNTPLNAQQ